MCPRLLRVGLLLDSYIQPKWVHRVVADIEASSIARVVLVVRNHSAPTTALDRLRRLWHNRQYIMYAAYARLDDAFCRVEPSAFEKQSLEPLLTEAPSITVQPIAGRYTDALAATDLETIRGHDLDVLLRFGFRILTGGVLGVARHGVWSYHHGDPDVNRGGPPGFWEVMHQTPTTGSVLQVLNDDLDNGVILRRSWSATISRVSAKRNKNNYYWKSASFVIRALNDLYNGALNTTREGYGTYSHPLFRRPTNPQMLTLAGRLAGRLITQRLSGILYLEQWCLGVRWRTSAGDNNSSFHRFKYLIPPKDRFWADPFPVQVGDSVYIFIEEYLYAAQRAHISVIAMDKHGKWEPPIRVLQRPYHLSYPFMFEWDGNHYMIPETAGSNSVELYRCTSFPFKWEFDRTLMADVRAADATLAQIDRGWLLFANIATPGTQENWDELHVFFAETPLGPWIPHGRNPVKSDVRNCRPAGHLFRHGTGIYRPAQDCSGGYGRAVVINKILRYDPNDFAEQEIARIEPLWDKKILGVHTFNASGDVTVIDCLRKRRRFM